MLSVSTTIFGTVMFSGGSRVVAVSDGIENRVMPTAERMGVCRGGGGGITK